MPEITQEQKTILFGLILAIVIGAGMMIWRSLGTPQAGVAIEEPDESSTDSRSDVSVTATITVHLTGHVRNPGVYQMRLGDRVVDLVRQAGGAVENADLDAVNLSAKLTDGQKVEIMEKVEPFPSVAKGTDGRAETVSPKKSSAKININRADLKELDSLPGIGPRTAQAIVDYRKENGRFSDLEELKNIKGLGKSKIEKLTPYITVH